MAVAERCHIFNHRRLAWSVRQCLADAVADRTQV